MCCSFRISSMVLGMILGTVSVSGCSQSPEPTYPVHGVVSINGNRPQGGIVIFESVTPGPSGKRFSARGMIDSDGQYCLSTFGEDDGAVAGNHRVGVLQEEDMHPSSRSPEAEAARMRIVKIPPRYQSPETSNLTYEVKPEENTIDIELH